MFSPKLALPTSGAVAHKTTYVFDQTRPCVLPRDKVTSDRASWMTGQRGVVDGLNDASAQQLMKRDPKTVALEQMVGGVKATLQYLPGHASVRGENTCPGFDERMSVPVSGVIAETLMPEFGERIIGE